MTFLDAVKSGRPMRRKATCDQRWLSLVDATATGDLPTPCWVRIAPQGGHAVVALCRLDYLADDWDVMP